MTPRQKRCAGFQVSTATSQRPGKRANSVRAMRVPTPRRRYFGRTKNSLISRTPSPANCARFAYQREARRPAVEAHDEMVAMVAPPESSVPAGRAERAVGLDGPAVAAEVVDVELDQALHQRHVGPSQRAKAEARHVVSGRGGARRIEQGVVEAGVDGGRADDHAHDQLAVDECLLPVRQREPADERAVLGEREIDHAVATRQLFARDEAHDAALGSSHT